MKDYIADGWKEIFARNGLRTFDDFWEFQANWFEQPNRRRGGWSGVLRCEMAQPGGGSVGVFMKRQENHVTRTFRHPIAGVLTLRREFLNLRLFERHRLPTVKLLYFAERRVNGHRRAVFLTEDLEGFRSLKSLLFGWAQDGWPSAAERRRMIVSLAETIRRMHAAGIQHNCLYAKHIFFKPSSIADQTPAVRIIDLEKAKRCWPIWLATRRDLITLQRHCPILSWTDRVRFFKAYVQSPRLRPFIRQWRALARRLASRNRASPRQSLAPPWVAVQNRKEAMNSAP